MPEKNRSFVINVFPYNKFPIGSTMVLNQPELLMEQRNTNVSKNTKY